MADFLVSIVTAWRMRSCMPRFRSLHLPEKREKMAVVFIKLCFFYAHVLKSLPLPKEQKTKMADFPVSTKLPGACAAACRVAGPSTRNQKQNGSYLSKYVGFLSLRQ
jgi:hypothetical protein